MSKIYAYHVITEKTIIKGQHILFDKTYHNGVYKRVLKKSVRGAQRNFRLDESLLL